MDREEYDFAGESTSYGRLHSDAEAKQPDKEKPKMIIPQDESEEKLEEEKEQTEDEEPLNLSVQPLREMTNHLLFLQDVVQAMKNHPLASNFQMYLTTRRDFYNSANLDIIHSRLENRMYYWSGRECIEEVELMFIDCYIHIYPGDPFIYVVQELHKFFCDQIMSMPIYEDGDLLVSMKSNFGTPMNSPRSLHDKQENNQLLFLQEIALKSLIEQEYVFILQQPFHAGIFKEMDVYNEEKQPLNLDMIEYRLKNKYYRNARECLQDFGKMFMNYYIYTWKNDELSTTVQLLHEFFYMQILRMPKTESDCFTSSPTWQDYVHGAEIEMFYDDDDEDEKMDVINKPPVIASPTRKGRKTNQLQFLHEKVLKSIWRHESAWPFHKPLDLQKFSKQANGIILNPMGLDTIRKRLENSYYSTAKECIQDFKTIFTNCYDHCAPEDVIFIMAREIEKVFDEKIAFMPVLEEELKEFIA